MSVVVVFMELCAQDDESGESDVEAKPQDTDPSECLASLFTSLFDFFDSFHCHNLEVFFRV